VLFFSSEWLFPEWNGSHNLGNNLYMMEWDGGGRIIVFCSNKEGRTCYGGPRVIPTNERAFDDHGNYAELVENAKVDERWIVVKSKRFQEGTHCYYLIDKNFNIEGLDWNKSDSIIQSNITGPLDSLEFCTILKKRNINLTLKPINN
jgi:hypothetical protein